MAPSIHLLTRLDINYMGRNLTEVPTDIPPNATHILLAYNRISRIRASVFANLKHCTMLNMRSNHIKTIDLLAFSDLFKLKFLSLKGNQLESLNVTTFQGLLSLDTLRLSINKIKIIEDRTFNMLEALRCLYLTRNFISQVTGKTFSGLKKLEILHLFGNRITTLAPTVFDDIPRPFHLVLHVYFVKYTSTKNARLHCDGRLCWLKEEYDVGTIRWKMSEMPLCSNGDHWMQFNCKQGEGISTISMLMARRTPDLMIAGSRLTAATQ